MTSAVVNLNANKINSAAYLNNPEKDVLRRINNNGGGLIAVVTAQNAGSSSTTPANTTLRINGLRAARRYLVSFSARGTNATAANGARFALTLTGTQTNAVVIGKVELQTELTTPTFVGVTAAGTAVRFVLGTNYGASGTGAGTNTVEVAADNIILIPQNDGDLIVQAGAGTGATASRIEPGSVLQVREITF